ncbi:MAG: hypothetical protein ACI8R9_002867 [Paraglaciecola sp.]|jgi:uncharacterized protein (TIGR01777 family)
MQILITGGTGLIGSNLIPKLTPHEITVLTRNVSMADRELGNNLTLISSLDDLPDLNKFDAVINLAGEPIVNKKWTDQQKAILIQSRCGLTEQLVSLFHASEFPPELFISGSAIGYYGRQGDELIDEDFDQPFDEFSHQLCQRWENAALKAASDATRVCILRTGVVVTRRGGALTKMMPPFRLGLGGPIGDGKQYMSWIHLEDMLDGIIHLIEHRECQGVYNFTSPNPVTNNEFSRTLASVLHRPCVFRVPKFVMRLMMGEMADLLLYGQRVIPKRLQQSGFEFRYPELKHALNCLRLESI